MVERSCWSRTYLTRTSPSTRACGGTTASSSRTQAGPRPTEVGKVLFASSSRPRQATQSSRTCEEGCPGGRPLAPREDARGGANADDLPPGGPHAWGQLKTTKTVGAVGRGSLDQELWAGASGCPSPATETAMNDPLPNVSDRAVPRPPRALPHLTLIPTSTPTP